MVFLAFDISLCRLEVLSDKFMGQAEYWLVLVILMSNEENDAGQRTHQQQVVVSIELNRGK